VLIVPVENHLRKVMLEIQRDLKLIEKKLFTGQPVRNADIGKLLAYVDEVLRLEEGENE
jgi:hypothetical protein